MRKIPVNTESLTILAASDQARDAAVYNDDSSAPKVIKTDENGNPLVKVAVVISDGSTVTTVQLSVVKGNAPEALVPLTPLVVTGLTISPYIQGGRVGLSGFATSIRLASDAKAGAPTAK